VEISRQNSAAPDDGNQQERFLQNIASAYILSISEYWSDIPQIAAIPIKNRMTTLKEFHKNFAERALKFLIRLSSEIVEQVRRETILQ
jgi:hypothetical protein